MALILVLLIICMALALSYAAVRSQFTGLKIQQNADRQISARQAAVTGLTMAIKDMHTSDWGGVDTALPGSLGSDQSFLVTYSVGDPSLGPGHPDYEDFPYRVTLLSIGSAADPDNPARVATYRIRAVVRLVPQKLEDGPTDWENMQKYTVYQTKNEKDSFELDIPCRLEGKVQVQNKLKIAKNYPPKDTPPRQQYLEDLRRMSEDENEEDCRPLTEVNLSRPWLQDPEDRSALDDLGVRCTQEFVHEVAADWAKPTSLISYQIYRGGPVYEVEQETVGTLTEDLLPNPQKNPLGIYYCSGTLIIDRNVTVRGSLYCKDDIKIRGTGVKFEPVELPGLHGADRPVRLPVASCRNFIVEATGGGSLTGLLAVFGKFQINRGSDTVSFGVTGRLITAKFYIKQREEWEVGKADWPALYDAFRDQFPGELYFPVWLGTDRGLDPKPRLTIKPDPPESAVTYHWKKWYNPDDPVYMLAPNDPDDLDDDGLHWELLEWTENP